MSYTTHMFPYSTHNMACYNIPRVSSLLSCNCARLTQGQNNNAPSLVIGILGHCYKAPKTAISHGLTPLPYSTPKMHLATSLLFKTGAALANLMQNMFELRGGTQKNSHNCSGLFLHLFENCDSTVSRWQINSFFELLCRPVQIHCQFACGAGATGPWLPARQNLPEAYHTFAYLTFAIYAS